MNINELYQIYQQAAGISTDSRSIGKDQLFFALRGPNFNGNKFAEAALQNGALRAIIDDKDYLMEGAILVPDSLKTLQKLASHHRSHFDIPLIAITGSNGKTTTKELMYSTLSANANVLATEGNLNNHIGVPLTLLRLTDKDEFAIIEMGANHVGEIAQLCQIAKPNFGMVTNIGKAHLEGFGGFQGVITGKSEMYDYLRNTGGFIFYNQSDKLLSDILNGYEKLIGYNPNDLRRSEKMNSLVSFKWKEKEVITQLTGTYNLINIAAAICVAEYFGVSEKRIAQALELYSPTNNRSQIKEKDGITFILDAYNANPTSMGNALDNFFSLKNTERYLVLGDMLEMGEYANEEHMAVVDRLVSEQFNKAFLIGDHFQDLDLDHPHIEQFTSVNTFLEKYKNWPFDKGSLVLLKGSRGIKLEKILGD